MDQRDAPGWPSSLLPRPEISHVVAAPPGRGPGYWAGAPSAAMGDDGIYLAYRLRRPVGAGRGYAVAVARSADGVRFEILLTITREQLAAESLERPSLVRGPDGQWRLYLSCATPATKYWRVELVEASHPSRFLRAIVAADGQHPVPSSREHASARASSTRRSLPEVGEFAHTQFITAMLIRSAPPLSDFGSRMGAASLRQMRSDAVVRADRRSLTSAYASERGTCALEC